MTAMTSESELVLVRHAMPLVSGDIASRDWPLSDAGRSDAEALARQLELPAATPVVSSDELKAKQTAEAFSNDIVIDSRLREVRRPWVEGDYESVARRWLEGEPLGEWESRSDVVGRMTEAASEAAALPGSRVCLVSHGLAISVLVGDLIDADPVELWSELRFPDYVKVDLRSSVARIERGGGVTNERGTCSAQEETIGVEHPPQVAVRQLHHVQLAMPAGGEAEAEAFYARLLGIPRVAKPAHLEARGGCWFEDANVRIHLGVESGFRPARKAHPALIVDDLAMLRSALGAAGVDVVVDQALPGYDRFYVSDPFGNRLEFMQPK